MTRTASHLLIGLAGWSDDRKEDVVRAIRDVRPDVHWRHYEQPTVDGNVTPETDASFIPDYVLPGMAHEQWTHQSFGPQGQWQRDGKPPTIVTDIQTPGDIQVIRESGGVVVNVKHPATDAGMVFPLIDGTITCGATPEILTQGVIDILPHLETICRDRQKTGATNPC